MQVVCAQCRTVCEVPAARDGAAGDALPCEQCGADLTLAIAEQAAAAGGATTWLVIAPGGGQLGPLDAMAMSQLLADGGMDWSTMVWRQGLKGWRPARRDAQLVTATAAVRGGSSSGDTQRIAPRRHLMPTADTVVQAAPPGLKLQSGEEELFSWPEPDDALTQVAPRALPEPTFAAAFRSAPSLLTAPAPSVEPASGQPVAQRRSSPHSWLPSAQSMLLVAVVAFAAGVLVAALWGRFSHSAPPRSSTVIVAPTPVEPRPIVAPPAPAPAPPPLAVAVTSMVAAPTHPAPRDEELRREVKRVSPDIRRCVNNLVVGADLEITFEGETGRVRNVKVRGARPAPGRLECITQAARQMQVEPFTQRDYRYLHKFAYGY